MKPLDLAAWAAALLVASTMFAHTVALRLLLLFVGLSLVAIAIARERRSLSLLPPLWVPLALWAAWSIASVLWSIEPERTIKELRSEVGYSIATFWLCFVAAQARDAVRVILPVMAVAAAIVCAMSIHFYYDLPWYLYALGLHGGPGNHSSTLIVLAPCALAAAWYGGRLNAPLWARGSAVMLTLLLVLSAYATLNRTIWIAFAIQLAVLGLFAYHGKAPAVPVRRARLALAVALGVALAAGVAVMLQRVQSERIDVGSPQTMTQDPRLGLWKEALERVEERPLSGYGFGRGLLRDSLRDDLNRPELWHSHNLFLDSALQTGIPGLVLLLMLFGATLRQGWHLARGNSLLSAVCGVVAIAVVLGTILRNSTDVLWVRQSALLYWAVMGILLAWGIRYRDRVN
jgi:O-antigen ligase